MTRGSFPQRSFASRRDILRLGGVSSLGLALPQLLEARGGQQTPHDDSFGRAKRVIMLYLHGGHPQQETFDPKPNGPSTVRGEFKAIATTVPGVSFSELLPGTARIADKLAVIRSMTHDNPNHVQASLPANTGHRHPPEVSTRGDFPPSDTDFPPFGAVIDRLQPNAQTLPSWVRVGPLMRRSNGTMLHGQLPGFLGARYSSFAVDQSLLGEDVSVESVRPADELSPIRLRSRRDLLKEFDGERQRLDEVRSAGNLNAFYQRAFDLLTSDQARNAFDLASEPASTRDRYGDTEFGQRCLLARRLVESGVSMVNVSYCHTPAGSWDTHSKNFSKMKSSLAPTLDAAFTALVNDLDERGLLDETLVVVNAEFGRTPAINKNAGRDHWPWVYSLALCGAGVRSGVVHGTSDDSAAYPTSDPHGPEDFAATLYHLLGVPGDTVLHDALGRPHRLVVGQPIREVLV
ncbi:MAG: DUF1501 domain-containing protein [Fuerstiella sp.]|nr:DUF1501 domain-containing protein [Fuerstiella sp.]